MDGAAVAAVLLAVAGGMGWLAINRPARFRAMFWLLLAAWVCISVALATWQMAIEVVAGYLSGISDPEVAAAAERVALLRLSIWTWSVVLASFLYLMLLGYLALSEHGPEGKLKREGDDAHH